jgi:hypothetical protein
LATSIAGGGFFTGWQWTDMMVRPVRHDRKILLIRPDTQHVTVDEGPITSAVERTHPGYLVAALPILGEDKDESVVVDLTALYVGQAESLVGSLARGRDPSLARLQEVKGFPENVEISYDLIAPPKGGEHGDILTVHYSLSKLPDNDYVPRLADDRIGYFLTVARDYSRDYRDPSTFVRYVNRWRLEKAEPKLELSPPKEPIIFYVEKTVPTRYRRWVRAGIEEWNRAFEEIGFVGAIEVRQQTETQFADLDPEDVRYNFFRWITSDSAFAMGPSRVDPRTGQILDADIIFDDSMLRWSLREWDLMIEEAMTETFSEADRAFLHAHPEWDPVQVLRRSSSPPTVTSATQALTRFEDIAELRPSHGVSEPVGSGRRLCSLGRGRTRQMALAALQLGLLADKAGESGENGDDGETEREWPEEFVGQVIKETVMHEVGHTLGLRHNFKASSWRPVQEMHGGAGEPVADLAGSVMDYNPLNVAVDRKAQGNWQMTTLGPYDHWATEYGYATTGEKKPVKELEKLRAVASRGAEPGHDYATDEDVFIGDPLVNRWDAGRDPLDFARERIALAHSLREEIVDRVVEKGASYAAARQAVDVLLSTVGRSAWLAANHLGGTYFHRDHRDDPGARDPIVLVSAEKQREALALLTESLFAADAWRLPPDLLSKVPPDRWSHWGTGRAWGQEAAYPYHDRLLAIQTWSLFRVLSPSSLRRLLDGETAAAPGADALTLPDLLATLTGSIFSELEATPSAGRHSNREPFVESTRRNLQRAYVGRLIALTLESDDGWYPQAARTQAWFQLKGLQRSLDRALQRGEALDDYSRAHLEESRERIARALEASFELGG